MKVACLAMASLLVSTSAMAGADDMALCGKLASAWRAAFNGGDAAKLVGMYDRAAGLYSNPYWTAIGRQNLEQGFRADFSQDVKYSSITCDTAERDGKLLVGRGTFAGSAKGPGGQTMPLTGHWFAAARAEGDGKYYLMTHNANIQLPSPK